MGDLVEIGMEAIDMSRTSITLKCVVRKKGSDTILNQIDKIVFVLADGEERPKPHYQTLDALKETA